MNGRLLLLFLTGILFFPLNSFSSENSSQVEGMMAFDSEQTMGVLSQSVMPDLYFKIHSEIVAIDSEVTPEKIKPLRIDIGKLKLLLDIFQICYPVSHKIDQWDKIRKMLDEGYEKIGNFKDLYDVVSSSGNPVDVNELETLRGKVLSWASEMVLNLTNDLDYLSHPLLDDFYFRPKKELPKYMWRIASFEPKPQNVVRIILRHLLIDVYTKAGKDLSMLYKITDLTKKDNEELFHDFRKEIRHTLVLESTFKNLFPKSLIDEELPRLKELVKKYGKLHDKLLAYHRFKNKNNEDSKVAKKEVNELWASLLSWQKNNDILGVLNSSVIQLKESLR